MRDKNDMINEIEMLLGSEGSREIAERIFAHLRNDGRITFDGKLDSSCRRWTMSSGCGC